MLDVIGFAGQPLRLVPTAEGIWPAMAEGVELNLSLNQSIPDPFASGVVYRRERRRTDGSREDIFLTWPKVLAAGRGDCEDLSAWTAAHLRQRGKNARVGLVEFPQGGWHAITLVNEPPAREDRSAYPASIPRYRGAHVYGGPDLGWDPAGWWILDASYSLGMRDPAAGSTWHPATTPGEREIAGLPGALEVLGPEPLSWRSALQVAGLFARHGLIGAVPSSSLPWADRLPPPVLERLVQMAQALKTDPRFLLAVLRNESNFDRNAMNLYTAASGYWQIMPRTARQLGTTIDAIVRMSPLEQIDLGYQYFKPATGKLRSLYDVYAYLFRPADMDKPDNWIYYAKNDPNKKKRLAYEQNASLDVNKDGLIQKWEPGHKAALLLEAEERRLKTGVSGIATLEESIDELRGCITVEQVSDYILRLTTIAASNLIPTLKRWVINVRKLELKEAQAVALNLTYHAHGVSRSFDPGLLDTMKNAASAVSYAAGYAVSKTLNTVNTTANAFNTGTQMPAGGEGGLGWLIPVGLGVVGLAVYGWSKTHESK